MSCPENNFAKEDNFTRGIRNRTNFHYLLVSPKVIWMPMS